MKFLRMTLTAALRALRRNKMRSALTILIYGKALRRSRYAPVSGSSSR